ncbi:FadR/GntR family transcriptional regulator [Aureimonas jatrophae]|uniref:DNA-binding transcriptional regulator, FadR family n=1 Tax=Aureimonas jatrophae TaxID=1166073 RepID=A0A1H0HQM3_9HYPH|nr:FadR/GntR family transcriptional regulator [Aureimonas jatrophae]MBB3950719.1 DNA-binding FadR family transcriptional regulator [Aureimonas jatrophae]SDO21423.1 DNA-binding transcriptional regulator, FadR family [Aureimonas jatrophae]
MRAPERPRLAVTRDARAAQPEFTTRSVRRMHGSIADWLGRRIVSGELDVGDTVPKELEFCAEAGVSRSTYREALRQVAAKGLIVSRTKTGTRVASRETWSLLDPDVLRWFFDTGTPPDWFIRSLYELRTMIEPRSAALAAERRTDEDLLAFETALKAMRECDVTQGSWHEADAGFHRAILRASHNPVLVTFEAGIFAAVAQTTAFRYRDMPQPHTRNPIDEHAAVFECIRAHDAAGAFRLMSELVDTALLDAAGTTMADLKGTAFAAEP